MGDAYNFFCKTCKVCLPMGKLYQHDRSDRDKTWQMSGVYSKITDRSHSHDAVEAAVLEKFLILHRNHELTLAPENLIDILSHVHAGPITYVTADQIMAASVTPDPVRAVELGFWIKQYGLQNEEGFARWWNAAVRQIQEKKNANDGSQ
jgi:hypothetical protein